jgi:hypothetical protein
VTATCVRTAGGIAEEQVERLVVLAAVAGAEAERRLAVVVDQLPAEGRERRCVDARLASMSVIGSFTWSIGMPRS